MKNFLCLICFMTLTVAGVCLDKIGTVVAAQGGLKAVGADQNERILAKGSPVFLGDTLMTDDTAKGQIRFTDGTVILLIPGSQYSVDSYSATRTMGKNQYVAKLSQGGVRVSTGFIAKRNPQNFEVSTPNATIGVRGTIFLARMFNGDLYVGSESGKVGVANDGGSLEMGSNQYAMASSQQNAPQLLDQRPDALNFDNVEPYSGTPQTGAGAVAAVSVVATGFAWGPALGSITIFGAIVGIVAGTASQSPQTFSHTH